MGRPLPRTWQPVARLEPTTVHCSCLLGTYLLPRTLYLCPVAPLDCAVGGSRADVQLLAPTAPRRREGGPSVHDCACDQYRVEECLDLPRRTGRRDENQN